MLNLIFENHYKSAEPQVGMGATELCYTDRHALTVVEVCSPKRIKVQYDRAIRADKNGMSDGQSYLYERDLEASVITLSLRKDGHWRKVGSTSGHVFMLGARRAYHDYSF